MIKFICTAIVILALTVSAIAVFFPAAGVPGLMIAVGVSLIAASFAVAAS